MQKRAILALLIAAVMMFSGCALIVTDTEKDNARVVLDVNGETIDKGTMAQMVNYTIEQNAYYNQMFQMMGMGSDYGYTTDPATVLADLMDQYTTTLLEYQKAKELGYDELSEEDMAAVEAAAAEEYEAMLISIQENNLTESENEGDALREEAIAYAEANGYYDMEYLVEVASQSKHVENLKKAMVAEVTVDDAELQAELDARVAEEKAAYETTLSDYGYEVNNGKATYYAPAGYRFVKQILVKYTEEDKALIDEKKSALSSANVALTSAQSALENAAEDADLEALQADVDTAQNMADVAQKEYDAAVESGLANIYAEANEAYKKAEAGEDFNALIEAYNDDPGMTDSENGYAVCEGYIYFDSAFTTAAMSLENVGDVSLPTQGNFGYYIVRYEAEIPEGAATLEDVREELTTEMLTAKQDTYYQELLDQWVAEADVKTYPEKMGY